MHEFLHAANKGGASHELGKPINETPNSVAQHNELFKADVKTPPLQVPNSPYAITKEHPFYKQLNLTEEQRSRAIVTHQKLNEYNTTFDDVQKVLYSQSNDF